MKEKIIVNPSNFLDMIKNQEAKIYRFEAGTYTINKPLVVKHKSMITALDVNDKPIINVELEGDRPAIHIISDNSYITNLNFINNNMNQNIIRIDGNGCKVMHNNLYGCKTAIISGGDDVVIKNNLISQFTQDGIQFSGQRTKILNNLIQDLIQLPSDDAHHHDAIQAWAGDPNSPLNSKDRYYAKYKLEDAIIEGNIIISSTDLNRELQGALQGITAFDGWMSGWSIKDNFINTHSTIHGITILGAIESSNSNFIISNNEIFKQCGDIVPEIHLKPARCWNKNKWDNVDNLTFNKNIKEIVDYNKSILVNNNCQVTKHF